MSPTLLTAVPPRILSPAHFPWEAGVGAIWRYSRNPIIGRNPFGPVARIYNSAVVPFQGQYAGVFRADYRSGLPCLHVGRSRDGLSWSFDPAPILLGEIPGNRHLEYAYDPRVTKIDDLYYVTWCNGYHGPTIGVARTRDFVDFEQVENAFLPANRNGVLFPRRIGGKYAMLSRPSDKGHTPFGDIYYSESPDMEHWGHHRFVFGPTGEWWQSVKTGAGPVPIETDKGWLLLYHGVMSTCNGFVYSMGVALLDLNEPWKVIKRSREALLLPEAGYEVAGFVGNVVFPCAALHDVASGRVAVYYGAADTVTAMAFTTIDALLASIDA